MGFEDVKVDGLSVDNLKKETERYNEIYFGKVDYSFNGMGSKGQLGTYSDKLKEYTEKEFVSVKEYFASLGWDCTQKGSVYTARANSQIYVSYQYDGNCFIEFKNGDVQKTYSIKIESDFKENPYYRLDTNSKGWGKGYAPSGGEATLPEMIKTRLDDIKAVIEYNDSLNGEYNFKIMVDKDGNNYNRYEREIEWKQYNSVMDIIKEISQEYF